MRLSVSTRVRGFTLVEVLCAVVLLSIGLLAVMAATQAGRESHQRATYLSYARCVAQSRIEQMRCMPYDSIASMSGTSTDPSLPRGNVVQVAVSGYPEASESNLCHASVTLAWLEGKITRRISYETLIARR